MTNLTIPYKNLTSASATYDPSKPIYMLNLWKYRSTASYPPSTSSSVDTSPCTGHEALNRYRTALRPLLPPNAERFFLASVVTEVIAPNGETWDDVAINRYESLAGFIQMVESKEYVELAQPHRVAGLEDMRLIVMDKIDF